MQLAARREEAFAAALVAGGLAFYVYTTTYFLLGVVLGAASGFVVFFLLRSGKLYGVRRVVWLGLSSIFWASFLAMVAYNGLEGIISWDRSYPGVPLIPAGPAKIGVTTKMEAFEFPQAVLPGTYVPGLIGARVVWPFDIPRFVFLALLPWVVTALFFGRAWCSWVCWFGGWVEGCAIGRRQRWRLLKLKENGPPLLTGLRPGVRSVKYVLLGLTGVLALWYGVQPLNVIAWSGPIGWFSDWPNIFAVAGIFAVFFILLPFMTKKKWFCLLCPVGAGFNLLGRVSPFTIQIDRSTCNDCNLCIPICPVYSLSLQTVAAGRPDSHCDRCFKCVDACPKGAIDLVYRGSFRNARPWFVSTIVIAAFLWYAWFIYTLLQLVPPLFGL